MNVYKNHHGEIVAQVASKWYLFDPETQKFLLDGEWVPVGVWVVEESQNDEQ